MARNSAEALIAVMGATGSGKSTFINLISGSALAVSDDLRSCTAAVQTSNSFSFEGRIVTLIDTPGFDDTTRTDTDVLRTIADYLSTSYQNGKKLNGILYMHRISDVRMGGIALRNFRMFRTLCGDASLANVVIVTTMWGEVSPEVGAARERELATDGAFFKPVLDKGARMCRHDGTRRSARGVLRLLVRAPPAVLQIQDELVNRRRALGRTAAGAELQSATRARDMTSSHHHQRAVARTQRELAAAAPAREKVARGEVDYARVRTEEAARVRAEHERNVVRQRRDRARAERQQYDLIQKREEDARRHAVEIQRLQEEGLRIMRERAQKHDRRRLVREHRREEVQFDGKEMRSSQAANGTAGEREQKHGHHRGREREHGRSVHTRQADGCRIF